MKYHPAVLMVLTWVGCIAAFYILPFQLEGRVMTLYGFMILMLFVATFCAGALIAGRPQPQQPRPANQYIEPVINVALIDQRVGEYRGRIVGLRGRAGLGIQPLQLDARAVERAIADQHPYPQRHRLAPLRRARLQLVLHRTVNERCVHGVANGE